MTLRDRLSRLKLLVVTGKGGVGKSVLTAALGRILSRAGRRVLLLENDPRENLYQLLGIPPSDGEIVQAEPDLFLQNLRPTEVLGSLVREHLKIEVLVRRVLASPVYQHFVGGAPGFKELGILGHALRVVRGIGGAPEIDLVILDAPATGHGVTLLLAPVLVSEVIPHGPVGHLAREVAGFVSDVDRCGVALATLAEEMPVQETIELREALDERLSRRPEVLVVNGLYPTLAAGDRNDPRLGLWHERQRINERELARLGEVWSGPKIELPLLPFDRGPDLLTALAKRLEPALAAPLEATCA
jgi:anion-transporting  ArsA/GET3 family ATPase